MQNTPNQLPNAFTVDLEDWFQGLTSTNPQVERWPEFESRVEQATDNLLALLRNQHVKATFFVLGYVADRHPDADRAHRRRRATRSACMATTTALSTG